ncbi:dephospho-CoA kinase [Plantactinospora siamensis]|uniref:Dephospho-CoA kinase n=1 Tax=Plantactinospora siamensis TaxID=555372 RepID=A0ABV6P0T0_9ACTN
MLRVGLTGGIGSGKSVVAARLAGHGAVLVDSDVIAREVVAPGTEGLRAVLDAFGDRVLGPDGGLDRPALAAVVFDDPAARARLNGIIHPRVRERAAALITAAPAEAIVVNDVPLLVEVGLAPTYHLVLVVAASRDTRVARLVRDRGMPPADAAARIAAQADDARRAAAADVLLRNDGELAELYAAVDGLWRDRLVPYESNLRHRRVAPAAPSRQVPADPSWPEQYARIAARIGHAAGPAALRIDHVGSTAVPGLAAKDVLDIQLTVADLADADRLAEPLAAAGFPRRPGDWWDNPRDGGVDAWPKRLHGSADPGRPVNLHLRATGTPGWRFALLMRDHLRADPERRDRYAQLKRRLAASGDPQRYAETKEPWFDEEHVAAERWAAATGWRP